MNGQMFKTESVFQYVQNNKVTHSPSAVVCKRQFLFFAVRCVPYALIFSICCCTTGVRGSQEQTTFSPEQASTIAKPFRPGDVTLLDGPFREAMLLDAQYLLSLESDRLLSWYRKEAGLEPKATVYGGWESRGIAGHSLGHYLSACARMAQNTGKTEFTRRVEYIVEELAKCQRAGGDGYVGAIPEGRKVFAEVARGEIRSAGFDLNGAWVPWYTLHKLFAGLLDAYQLCDNQQALDVVLGLADWTYQITENLTDKQWQEMLACEHGGMNEVLADLYAITGEDTHLELATKFYHKTILDPLAEGRDELAGKHANTQIPKVTGAARIYELTGEQKFAKIARFFWETVTADHTYVIGGNSLGEHFGPPGRLNDRLGRNTAETCNTYNMIKLSRKLFAQTPHAHYTDYIERALWNHILASQNSQTGMVCYFVSLQPGGSKAFMGPEEFTCCSGTGMENHARYSELIYSHAGNQLWVNQYISSEVTWKTQDTSIRQVSQFPENGEVQLTVSCDRPKEFALHLRHPHWAEQGFEVEVNGESTSLDSSPGSFVTLERRWEDGDVVTITMPMHFRLEHMPDNQQRAAVFCGPILLAGVLEEDNAEEMLPVLVTNDRDVEDWVQPVEHSKLTFKTHDVGRPHDVSLRPFFTINDKRYIVYWDLFDEQDWQRKWQEYQAERQRQKELDDRTVDLFAIGEMQPERDHNVQGENTSAEVFNGRKLRHAWDGGWFSFDIALPEDQPADLIITYWGSETGNRTFDILLDGEKLATQTLHQDNPGEFWDKVYPLPEISTAGKTRATIRFQAHPGNFAGGVFGVRVVERDSSQKAEEQ